MGNEKVTSRQIALVVIISRASVAISTTPALNLPPYNQDMWVVVVLSFFITCGMMVPLLYLANELNEFSIIGYLKKIYGNIVGSFIGALYGLCFIIISINSMTIQSEYVKSTILNETSQYLIVGLMIIACIYCVSRGLMTSSWTIEILAPICLSIILFIIVLGIRNVDYTFLLPILSDSSLKDISQGALQLSLFFTDIFLLTMIVPDLENKKDVNKIFIKGAFYSLLLLLIIVILCQGTLGIEQTLHTTIPFLVFTRTISLFTIFERIEPIFVMAWLIASLTRITGFIYIAVRTFRELLGKDEKEKLIVYIIGVIVSLISLFILARWSVIGSRKGIDLVLGILSFVFIVVIPSITAIIYFFRKKSLTQENTIQ